MRISPLVAFGTPPDWEAGAGGSGSRRRAPGILGPGASQGWLLPHVGDTVGRVLRPLVAAVTLLAVAFAGRAQACPADCDSDAVVAVNELITCVGIVLAGGPTAACPACDGDADGVVAINELIAGVNSALGGCAGGDLPDLAPVAARSVAMNPECITDTSEIDLRLEVCVANQGTADSGPFDVVVLGEPFGRVPGLAAGAQTCLRGPFVPFSIDVDVDVAGEVAETDELDNFDSFYIPRPSPPPFCVPTETPTETPVAGAAPAVAGSAAPGSRDAATPIPTETPAGPAA